MIPVIYANKKPGMVLPVSLDKLIATNQIIAFCHHDSWVCLDEGPIRTNECNDNYYETERRRNANHYEEVTSGVKEKIHKDSV